MLEVLRSIWNDLRNESWFGRVMLALVAVTALTFAISAVVAATVLWTKTPLDSHSWLFPFVDPQYLYFKAGSIAVVVIILVLDPAAWQTNTGRLALIFGLALVMLVVQLACSDFEAARLAPSSALPNQCFVENGVGTNGYLTVTDALYFAIGTLSTAGTGNVQPFSQFCRSMVMWQTAIGTSVVLLGVGGLLWRMMQSPSEQYEGELALAYRRQGDLARTRGRLEEAEQLYQHALVGFEALTRAEPANTAFKHELLWMYRLLEDVAHERDDDERAVQLSREELAIARDQASASSRKAVAQRDLLIAHQRLADRVKHDDVGEAEGLYREALRLAQTAAKVDPDSEVARRDLSESQVLLADLLQQGGRGDEEAESLYRSSLAIAEASAQAAPSDPFSQWSLLLCSERLGSMLFRQQRNDEAEGFRRRELALAQARATQPSSAEALLALWGSYLHMGSLMRRLENPRKAKRFHRQALTVAETLAKTDPANGAGQKRLLYTYENLNDAALELDELALVERLSRKALRIAEGLAEADRSDASRQESVWVWRVRLGEVALRRNLVEKAEGLYRQALASAQSFADAEPSGTAGLDNLYVSYELLGELMSQRERPQDAKPFFRKALTIARKLAKIDSSNTSARRRLSLAYEHLQNVAIALGETEQAERLSREALQLAEAAANADPSDRVAQRSIWVWLVRMGDALIAGDVEQKDAYRRALTIATALAQTSSAASEQADLSLSYGRMGYVMSQGDDTPAAKTFYRQALAIAEALTPPDSTKIEDLRMRLSALD